MSNRVSGNRVDGNRNMVREDHLFFDQQISKSSCYSAVLEVRLDDVMAARFRRVTLRDCGTAFEAEKLPSHHYRASDWPDCPKNLEFGDGSEMPQSSGPIDMSQLSA